MLLIRLFPTSGLDPLFPEKCSRTKIAPPITSPEEKKLWIIFVVAKRIGAAIPIFSNDGMRPMAPVAIVMPDKDSKIAFFRPHLSPINPNTIAPRGRDISPRGSIAYVKMRADVMLTFGKKMAEMNGARSPKRASL